MLSVLSRIIDIAMVGLGALIAAAVHNGSFVWLNDMESVSLLFNCLLVVVFFPPLGIYQSWRGKPVYDLLWRASGAWLLVEGTGILMSFSLHRSDQLSRLWLGYWAVATILLLIVTKALVHGVLKGLRREGFNQQAVAIVGGALYGRFLIEQMRSRPEAGFSPVVVFDEPGGRRESDRIGQSAQAAQADTLATELEGIPVERDFDRMVRIVRTRGIRELWLALPMSRTHDSPLRDGVSQRVREHPLHPGCAQSESVQPAGRRPAGRAGDQPGGFADYRRARAAEVRVRPDVRAGRVDGALAADAGDRGDGQDLVAGAGVLPPEAQGH